MKGFSDELKNKIVKGLKICGIFGLVWLLFCFIWQFVIFIIDPSIKFHLGHVSIQEWLIMRPLEDTLLFTIASFVLITLYLPLIILFKYLFNKIEEIIWKIISIVIFVPLYVDIPLSFLYKDSIRILHFFNAILESLLIIFFFTILITPKSIISSKKEVLLTIFLTGLSSYIIPYIIVYMFSIL